MHHHEGHIGHDKHEGHHTGNFLVKFWISLVLTVPIIIYSDLPQALFGWTAPLFPGSQYVALVLSTAIFFYPGWIFLVSAWKELKAKLPGMMTLIALAITAAYLYSIYSTFYSQGHTLFWELATLITVMLLGHWMEMKAVQGAQGALQELSKLLPDTAEIVKADTTEIIPLEELKIGDVVMVRPGGKIPTDGMIIEGKSDVSESMITGESIPVNKSVGIEVYAGTINGDGSIKIKVTKLGENTFLSGIMRLIAEAQASKSRLQLLSDRAAFYLTIIAIAGGGITLVTWLALQSGPAYAMERFVAVLVITCPHALGLAIPLVASISTTMAARNGFLVRQRAALESARNIGVVLFDKTGTLTKGEYGVEKIWPIHAMNEKEVLQLAASVDTQSEHFVARAIMEKAKEYKIHLLAMRDFLRMPGMGVSGIVEGQEIFVGGRMLAKGEKKIPEIIQKDIQAVSKKGHTILYVYRGKYLVGAMSLTDLIRKESRDAITDLKKMGLKVAMITGDSEDVAQWVAQDLGIDEYFAGVLPREKADKVKLLQQRGVKVAMVGDGINDAPALTQADLGIAIGAGTNVAIESAGIILVRNDPRDIARIIRLSKFTYAKMIQNLFWATGYNIVALPLAAGVLASKGIVLQPTLSAIFMSLSTVIVAINALALRQKKLS